MSNNSTEDNINNNQNQENLDDDIDDVTSMINNIKWTPEHENILVEWADQAMCYKCMHSKSTYKV